MRIGTDISIAICRKEGYLVMDYKVKDLVKKGVLDKDCRCEFTASNPSQWNDSGKPMIGNDGILYLIDTSLSFNDLLDIIKNPKVRESVSDFCDWEKCPPELDNPTPHDMLNLASDIRWSIGLE